MTMFRRVVGEGRPVVLLHGLFGSGENWATLAGKMQGLQVHLPDLRNHGQSFWADEFRHEDLAHDLAHYIKVQGLGRCVLAGHSLGAKAAMRASLDYPELAEALICFDMAPRAYEPQYGRLFGALRRLDLSRVSSRSQAREILAPDFPDASTLSFVLKSLVADEGMGGQLRWRLNLQALAVHYDEIWKGIAPGKIYSGPAFFVAGANSDYFGPRDLDLTLDLFPQAQVVAIANAGHWLHADQPHLVLAELRHWLTTTLAWELPEWT